MLSSIFSTHLIVLRDKFFGSLNIFQSNKLCQKLAIKTKYGVHLPPFSIQWQAMCQGI